MKIARTFFLILGMMFFGFLGCDSTGLDGTPGANGTDGTPSFVRTTPEEAGDNCTFGGKFVELGVGEEVTSTYYACNLPSITSYDYKLGDIGPAGGYIFFIDKDDLYEGWTYLEAAPVDTEQTSLAWGGSGTLVGTLFGIGQGKVNTAAIVAYEALTNPAADHCDSLDVDGIVGWFLPSLNELFLMRQNLYMQDLGSFSSIYYWSSSEYDPNNAWYQDMFDGYQDYGGKDDTYYVRCARAF